MQKFLALYMATVEQQAEWKNTSPEDQEKEMGAWMEWMNAHQDSWVDMGNPVGKNQRVTTDGSGDSQNEVCGYSIVQAGSAEAAAALFTNSPHANQPNCWVDLMPIVDMEME